MKFSQRIGKTELNKQIQLDDIDSDLKNCLWNIYNSLILECLRYKKEYQSGTNPNKFFFETIWHSYFKKAIDKMPLYFDEVRDTIRTYFFSCDWFLLYDFIEFSISTLGKKIFNGYFYVKDIYESFNIVLERECSGYRFIDKELTPITNILEIEEIEQSLTNTKNLSTLKVCNTHLKSALSKLSDRKNPDYRNSIKESISAVEAISKIISKNSKDSLGAALDKIKGKLKIHVSLEKAFKQIYGYTSDTDGIRHALVTGTSSDFADAKFMLVACSAFINFLIMKSTKAGIDLQ